MLIIEESKEDYSEIDAEDSNLYPDTNENHDEPISEELQDGYVHTYQDASVYIPVEITPCADSGEIKTSCCGEPTVTFHEDRCSSKYCFTIIQPICVEVPLEISAEALLGSLQVKCAQEGEPGGKDVCEETCGGSSSEQESLKPSPPKNCKIYF